MPTTHFVLRRLHRRHRTRTGHVLIYSVIVFTMMIGFCSFGVDLGHAQMVKQQLESACIAAARYGAAGLQSDAATATAQAITAAAANNADGSPVVITSANIAFGNWNTSTRTFTVVTGSAEDTANAIQVTCSRTAAQGNAVYLSFASIIGHSTIDITVSNIAMVTRGLSQTSVVMNTSNPFLSGEPNGAEASVNNPANSPDWAPAESPVQFNGLNINAGNTITFDSVSGSGGNSPGGTSYGADGNPNDIETNSAGNEHHIASMTGPLNSVVGVFLNNSLPDNNTTPASLDFSTDAEQDYSTLYPLVQQVFFIGDGRMDNGTLQHVVVPTGATRLFIGTWDGYQWNNNFGQYTIAAHDNPVITLVQ